MVARGVAAICLLGRGVSALLIGPPESAAPEVDWRDTWSPFDSSAEEAQPWRREDFERLPVPVPDANTPAGSPLPGHKGEAGPARPTPVVPAPELKDEAPVTIEPRLKEGEEGGEEWPFPRKIKNQKPKTEPKRPVDVKIPFFEDLLDGFTKDDPRLCENCNGVYFTPDEKYELMRGTDGTDNVCMFKHLVPQLFIIGSISGGTTSFCSALEHSPSMDWPIGPGKAFDRRVKPTRWKEGHYFDKWFTNGIEMLINDYHECDRTVRKVAVEGSARYALDRRVPGRIAMWYGIPLASKIKFVMIFRDPVARFHSHYWKAINKLWCFSLAQYDMGTITYKIMKYNATFLENGGDYGGCGDVLESGYYTKQINYWYEFYPPQQFVYFPFRLALRMEQLPNYPSPHVFLWHMMGVRGKEPPKTYENANSHPKLHEELTPLQIQRFREFLYRYNSPTKIAELIAPTAATLYGLQANRTVENVAAWLENNW